MSKGQKKKERAYFFPKQFLGPNEKGCRTALMSFLYSSGASGSQRSGTNASALWKLDSVWYAE